MAHNAQFVVAFAALVVWLYLRITDDAAGVLSMRAGLPHDTRSGRLLRTMVLVVAGVALLLPALPDDVPGNGAKTTHLPQLAKYTGDSLWSGADTSRLVFLEDGHEALVRYGRELIVNTARHLGPNGIVMRNTNGHNCQNCHLDAGTRPWGNNYGAVWSTYPKYRARSGGQETVVKRVNDCIERSLNGTALDSTGREMRAILAYMEWLGTGIGKGIRPKGTGIQDLPYLDRAADTARGEAVFRAKCTNCHGTDGQGRRLADGRTYQYPPLWGEHSYNQGAGLLRLSRFAGYVKANMPQGATWDRPQLTNEEAWDVAAYVNTRPRPPMDLSKDWPDIAKKPVDHPFGPYKDNFPEHQHKYGPFAPIAASNKRP